MNFPVDAESALRWILTYSLHSAVLGAAGLLAARVWLGPGSRRAVVLKVALFGALLSASLPWKAIAPLEFAGQAGDAAGSHAEVTAPLGPRPELVSLAGAGVVDAAVPEGAGLAGTPGAVAAPSMGLSRLDFSASWWMALVGGVSALLLGRMAFQRARFLRSLSRRPLRDPASQQLLASWSAEAGTGAVALTASRSLRAPVALSSKEICVPQGCWDELSGEDRRALLAHEFAHIERRDPVWFTAAAALERVFFFLPWHRLVRERLNASAEVACDARAAARMGSTTSVARCLASVASWGATARTGYAVPASIPAMAAGPGELVTRVRHLLDEDERPVGRRFGVGAAIALVGFACCAPAVTTPQGSDRASGMDVESRAFIGAIEVEVSKDGIASARRSSDYPAMEPIQADLGTRAGKDALRAWIVKAAADLEVWSGPRMEAAGMPSAFPVDIHDGAIVISGSADVELKYMLWIMSMAGDRAVSMPDVRMRVGEVVYPVPLPVDVGVSATMTSQRGLEIRLEPMDPARPGQGVKYSMATTDRLAGMQPVEEEILEDEESTPEVRLPAPVVSTSLEGFIATAKDFIKKENIVGATLEGRKGTRMVQMAEVLDALIELGITDITFKGSYEN